MTTTNIQEKPTEKQVLCPVCGLDLQAFYEMFGVEATCCDLHSAECPVCAKELK